MSLVEHKLPEHPNLHTVLSGIRVARSLVFCVVFCPFVPFFGAIVLSALIRFTDSDYLPLAS
jgi:hypothetical protein